ncbi:GNAT family N-acetyltransferase [Thioalkalivibrio thiocyanodenitrificans]|uniref:GNAT family N-acetyltransferase n=1 Tax=Thioalkalivibrio thiocyanodenitrificans TaxID=243063 RepID=UPI00035E1780|nr:GNAT family N-acetyltransferase [Thioalkalivibrio thiocyanodenitrificans]
MRYATKQGEPIVMERLEDTEPHNRGWVVHSVDAWIGRSRAGYLKISYIPRENLKALYKHGIWDWLRKIKGRVGMSFGVGTLEFAKQAALGFCSYDTYLKLERGEMPIDEALELLEAVERRHQRSYREFLGWFVDKPVVDFVGVEEEWRRRGIGTALYIEATRWMNERNLRLYGSTCVVPGGGAEETWRALSKAYSVAHHMGHWGRNRVPRRYLELSEALREAA